MAGARPGRAGADPRRSTPPRASIGVRGWTTARSRRSAGSATTSIRELGEAGLCGLYVDEEYGGQGLSQTGYARVFETFAQIDATLSIVLGVHQSIGFKGIHMFGTDEQKERFLPDLAAGRKLAGFALTEPEAGSDAYDIKSRAVQQPDGSWRAQRREALHRQRLEGRRCSRPSRAARSTARTATSR